MPAKPKATDVISSFDWDQGNTNKNWKKHKVSTKESEETFTNEPRIITLDRKHSKLEKRYHLLGITNKKRKLNLIFTLRGEKLRIISARPMNKKERRFYEKFRK